MQYPLDYKYEEYEHRGDCGIVAIAAATGSSYEAVWDWFKKKEERPDDWTGETRHANFLEAFKAFGKYESYLELRLFTRLNFGFHLSLSDFVEASNEDNSGLVFVVQIENHYVMVKGTMILDNHEIKDIKYHCHRNRQVHNVWLVK